MDVTSASYDRVLPRASVLVARGTFYIIALFLIGSIFWASITTVNVVVHAEGHLAPRAEPVRLSVPLGGIVTKVLVDVGARVSASQPLLEIDSFREAADASADYHELEQAKGESARYTESARMLERATVSVAQELASEQQVMKLVTVQAKELREGLDRGAVSLFELQVKQREVAETQGRLAQLGSDLARSEGESRQSRRMEAETAQKIKSLQFKLSRDTQARQKSILSAPTAGIVTTMGSLRPGRYLAANDVAVTIIPGDEPLMAEVWIPNDSMRRIKPPLRVRLKMKAYPYQQFGLLPATLVSVDPDADTQGAYRAWIRPDRLTLAGAHGIEALGPGLALTAEIVVDQRTILDVILDPIRRLRRGFSISE